MALALALLLARPMRVAYALVLVMACGDSKPATPDSNTPPVDAPNVDGPVDILSAADLAALGMQ